ncbi:hypothetical protein UFOVP1298_69 [uncultured Caudovirales phage]|uniref:Uncharacterized protein n=1 Tax=uncultured Caudovirales phage TaxID=2100421 RepID=A0A6J5RRK6_9CAUD|nr:hypothetical protein UFOVP1298_69 [uncultured Caudovirales phage]
MSMLASGIITRTRIILNDADGVRWLDAELIAWLNDAQRVIALVRPDASVSTSVVTMVTGTKQTIPTDGLRLLDVVRNINADGSGGRVVRNVDRDVMDTQNINWHSDTPVLVSKNYIYDNRNPKYFYVYPPATTATQLEILYSKNPTDCVDATSTLGIPEIYADPLLNYVLYRAYAKDAEFAQNQQLSASYLQIFQGMLGIKTQKDAAYSPDLNSKGASPNPGALQMGGV